MDENMDVEVGDCAQIRSPRSKFNGAVGRVTNRFVSQDKDLRNLDEWAEICVDKGIYVRVKLKNLIPRHIMACAED